MASRRIERVAELMKQEISRVILFELQDPRVGVGAITILRVDPAPDIKSARVFVSVLGDEEKQKIALRGLERARGRIQTSVADHLKIRYTPVLTFILDQSVKKSIHMSQLIDELARQRGEAPLPEKQG
ncbi:MAG: 30S ribosome-binding factor RbfA [Planctomycetes bacterium]|nr:30S ribosome-binding factor RbfA [Planctomycetota bacterium]MBM4080553.1 30S ribosome-binding factor RbfA [Planctomycetota bacterium]MBM4083856.1 30S ribosome-binding factor RbfA [Planctomycetota bacterium]